MSVYKTLRTLYHRVVPQSVRRAVYLNAPRPLAGLRRRLVTFLEARAPHDDVYDRRYYEELVEPTMAVSSQVMARSIVDDLAPSSVIDVGCGTGALLAALGELKVSGRGVDYATAAVEICRQKGLNVDRFDIEADPIPPVQAHTVISTEVAEHLPASSADRFVDLVTSMAEHNVVLSAAVPGSGGTDHVNEQPNEYWIAKLERRGFTLDGTLTATWRSHWKTSGVAFCFYNSVMVFRRQG